MGAPCRPVGFDKERSTCLNGSFGALSPRRLSPQPSPSPPRRTPPASQGPVPRASSSRCPNGWQRCGGLTRTSMPKTKQEWALILTDLRLSP